MAGLLGAIGKGVSRGAKSISKDLETQSARKFQSERDEAMFLRQQSLAQLGIDATAEQGRLGREQKGMLATERGELQIDLAEQGIDAKEAAASQALKDKKSLLQEEYTLKSEAAKAKGTTLKGSDLTALNKQALEVIKAEDELRDPDELKAEAIDKGFKTVAAYRKSRVDDIFEESLSRFGLGGEREVTPGITGANLEAALRSDPTKTLASLKAGNADPKVIKRAEEFIASLTPKAQATQTKKKRVSHSPIIQGISDLKGNIGSLLEPSESAKGLLSTVSTGVSKRLGFK
ncbi:MAG: hypothetical protein KAS32_18225 [Candidatus Peribacteraceae bacterium]|nr:hypothetical protein [Candidatus Peribacteraceae bacterium]